MCTIALPHVVVFAPLSPSYLYYITLFDKNQDYLFNNSGQPHEKILKICAKCLCGAYRQANGHY